MTMKNVLNSFFGFLFFFFLFHLPSGFSLSTVDENYLKEVKKEWTFLYEKNGIHVFKKSFPGTSLSGFRGIGVLQVPLPTVLHVIRDVDHSHLWTPNLDEKRLIQNISLLEGITYNVNSLPWPATDRDSVLHSKLIMDKEKRFLNIITKSVEHPAGPTNKKYIRGEVLNSEFLFRPLADGTFVDLYAVIDPKGLIPAWLINFIQSKWPYNFLKGLEEYAKKGGFNIEPEFVKMTEEIK